MTRYLLYMANFPSSKDHNSGKLNELERPIKIMSEHDLLIVNSCTKIAKRTL